MASVTDQGQFLLVRGRVGRKQKGTDNSGESYYNATVQWMGGETRIYFDSKDDFDAFPPEGTDVEVLRETYGAKGVVGALKGGKLLKVRPIGSAGIGDVPPVAGTIPRRAA